MIPGNMMIYEIYRRYNFICFRVYLRRLVAPYMMSVVFCGAPHPCAAQSVGQAGDSLAVLVACFHAGSLCPVALVAPRVIVRRRRIPLLPPGSVVYIAKDTWPRPPAWVCCGYRHHPPSSSEFFEPRFGTAQAKSSSLTSTFGHLLPEGTPTKSLGRHVGFRMVK